jgi:hypothetical protein
MTSRLLILTVAQNAPAGTIVGVLSERRGQYNSIQFHIIEKSQRLFRHFHHQSDHGVERVDCAGLLSCAGPRRRDGHAI